MELLILIHHPNVAPRPLKELLVEVRGTYDPPMGVACEAHCLGLGHSSVLLLRWPALGLGWPAWHPQDRGTLVTVGMPLLYAPPGGGSEMLRPDKLSSLILAEPRGASSDLGYCGGYFAAAYATRSGQVRLVTNYLAEVPLYRAEGADGLIVWSTKAAAAALLAGIDLRLDQRAAREFLLLSNPLENRTLFEGVTTEPAAMCLTIDAHGVRRRPYLKLPSAYFAHRQAPDQVAQSVLASMRPLIETLKRSDVPARIHLSGGIDSRAVAAICTHHGFRPTCVTHNAPAEQVACVRQLARFLRLPYQVVRSVDVERETFFQTAAHSLWQSDGMMSLKYLCGQYDLELVRDTGYLPIEGYGGEHGRAYYYDGEEALEQLNQGLFETVFVKMFGGRGAMWPIAEDVDQIRATLGELIEQAQAAGLDSPATATWLYVSQRMRRGVVARRNTGWHWVIDPLQMPCWTYHAMSADPHDQIAGRLVVALTEAAARGAGRVATVSQRAAAARKRRQGGLSIIRSTMRLYDGIRPRPQLPVQLQTLETLRAALLEQIDAAADILPHPVSADLANGWLEHKPWSFNQVELFWNTATLAMWCQRFIAGPPAIGCAVEQG